MDTENTMKYLNIMIILIMKMIIKSSFQILVDSDSNIKYGLSDAQKCEFKSMDKTKVQEYLYNICSLNER